MGISKNFMLCLEECGIVLFCPKTLLKSGKKLRFSADFREFHILRDTMKTFRGFPMMYGEIQHGNRSPRLLHS